MSFRLIVVLLLVELSSSYAQPAGTFTATGSMITPRWRHTATLLNNGKVLIAGGQATDVPSTASSPPLASAELYDPSTGTFVQAGSMTEPRAGHTASLLPDGRVLIAGAWNGLSPQAAGTAEIYDPSTNAFTSTGSMRANLTADTATLLNNGKVLITAGDPVSELYDPAMGTFAPTGSAPTTYAGPTATLLPDGRVLILPGYPEGDTQLTEIYDPATGLFSIRDWVDSLRFGSTATLLTTGKVLVTLSPPECDGSLDQTALYDSEAGKFIAAATMAFGACLPTRVTLSDGKVLLAGGWFAGPHSQVYDPGSDTFIGTGDMASDRHDHTATLLNDGTVLIAGGLHNVQDPVLVAELYHPAVAYAPPALFSLSGDGRGQGAILHAGTQQVVSTDNPATAGEALEIYGAGLIDGSVIPPQVATGGRLAEVLFFGKAPGYAGLNQVNVRIPDGIIPGPAVPVRLNYMGRPSNEVTLYSRA
ncbi:Kelch repeat-containing protein [Candidatus Sulfopaludibacter sp. SbA6]|nr:Kelch repeat-containing protein [Candidatus Sulfopaludibacter sp. SbA6]